MLKKKFVKKLNVKAIQEDSFFLFFGSVFMISNAQTQARKTLSDIWILAYHGYSFLLDSWILWIFQLYYCLL